MNCLNAVKRLILESHEADKILLLFFMNINLCLLYSHVDQLLGYINILPIALNLILFLFLLFKPYSVESYRLYIPLIALVALSNCLSILIVDISSFAYFQTLFLITIIRKSTQLSYNIYVFHFAQTVPIAALLFVTYSHNLIQTIFYALAIPAYLNLNYLKHVEVLQRQASREYLIPIPEKNDEEELLQQHLKEMNIAIIAKDLSPKYISEKLSLAGQFFPLDKEQLRQLSVKKLDQSSQKRIQDKMQKQFQDISLEELLKVAEINSVLQVIETSDKNLNNYILLIAVKPNFYIFQFLSLAEYAQYVKRHYAYGLMNRLFASFSHEFGTLLNQIMLYVQLAKDRIEHFPYFDSMLNAGRIMHNMVNDLQDFYMCQTKTFVIKASLFNISDLFNELSELYALMSEGKKILLTFSNLVVGSVKQDQQRIMQILVNLISNAFKYTDQGGSIDIIAEDSEDDNKIKFIVKDTGIGMSLPTQTIIREMLTKDEIFVESKISQGTAGIGLGFLNVKALIANLSVFEDNEQAQSLETLNFESEEGKGSKFWFYVRKGHFQHSPQSSQDKLTIVRYNKRLFVERTNVSPPRLVMGKAKSQPHQGPQSCKLNYEDRRPSMLSKHHQFFRTKIFTNSDQENMDSINESDQGDENITQSNQFQEDHMEVPNFKSSVRFPVATDLPVVGLMRKESVKFSQILIVDDEIANIIPLMAIIQTMGEHCDYALNGHEAIKMAANKEYKLILMDINMPIIDGIQTTKIIKESSSRVSIVACSAFSDPATMQSALSSGMSDYLQKPVKKEQLQHVLNKYLD